MKREEAAREIAERKAASLVNSSSQKEARTSSVTSSLNRKASMISLGVQSSIASGGPRKQSCPTLTLDQMLINRSSKATDGHAPHELRYGTCRDQELSRRRMSAIRKNRKSENFKRVEVERSNDTAPCKTIKKKTGSHPCPGTSAKESIDEIRPIENCALQAIDRDQQQRVVRRRSVETIAHSKLNSGASHS